MIGIQPPNGQALSVLLATFAATAALWILVERRRFVGPPRILDAPDAPPPGLNAGQ
jgi:hypothetical protein